jgi:hypothetical protein
MPALPKSGQHPAASTSAGGSSGMFLTSGHRPDVGKRQQQQQGEKTLSGGLKVERVNPCP